MSIAADAAAVAALGNMLLRSLPQMDCAALCSQAASCCPVTTSNLTSFSECTFWNAATNAARMIFTWRWPSFPSSIAERSPPVAPTIRRVGGAEVAPAPSLSRASALFNVGALAHGCVGASSSETKGTPVKQTATPKRTALWRRRTWRDAEFQIAQASVMPRGVEQSKCYISNTDIFQTADEFRPNVYHAARNQVNKWPAVFKLLALGPAQYLE